MSTRAVLFALLGSFAMVVACGSGDPASPSTGADGGTTSGGPTASAVTFHRDVEPILQKSCQTCHVAGGIAPFALTSYADVKPMAPSIVDATHSRILPPWGAQETARVRRRGRGKTTIV